LSGIIREIALLGGVVLLVHEAVLNPKNLLQGRVMRVTEIAEKEMERIMTLMHLHLIEIKWLIFTTPLQIIEVGRIYRKSTNR